MRNENWSGAIGNGDNREGNRRKFTGESAEKGLDDTAEL